MILKVGPNCSSCVHSSSQITGGPNGGVTRLRLMGMLERWVISSLSSKVGSGRVFGSLNLILLNLIE